EECSEPGRAQMDIDLIGPDVDAIDQDGQEGTLLYSGQLGPAVADFHGARDQPALRRPIGKPCRLVDAAGVEKHWRTRLVTRGFDLRERVAPWQPSAISSWISWVPEALSSQL